MCAIGAYQDAIIIVGIAFAIAAVKITRIVVTRGIGA